MSEKKEDNEKYKSVEEKIIETHPKFLKTIREFIRLRFWVHYVLPSLLSHNKVFPLLRHMQ